MKRRLEVRGQAGGVTVYDDFAHHPTAVAVTLQALRALGGAGRLVAVFEPRSYTSRTKLFQDEFARAFAAADRVVIAAAHLPGKVPEGQRLSEQDLVDGIRRSGVRADFVATVPADRRRPGRDPPAGRPRGDPVERRLRRDPRPAHGGAPHRGQVLILCVSPGLHEIEI